MFHVIVVVTGILGGGHTWRIIVFLGCVWHYGGPVKWNAMSFNHWLVGG